MVALTGTSLILPPASDVVIVIPRPAKVPSLSNVNPWEVLHMAEEASADTMTAGTVRPARWALRSLDEAEVEAETLRPGA